MHSPIRDLLVLGLLKVLSADELNQLSLKERVQRLEQILTEVRKQNTENIREFQVAVIRSLVEVRNVIERTKNDPLALSCVAGNLQKSCFIYWLEMSCGTPLSSDAYIAFLMKGQKFARISQAFSLEPHM